MARHTSAMFVLNTSEIGRVVYDSHRFVPDHWDAQLQKDIAEKYGLHLKEWRIEGVDERRIPSKVPTFRERWLRWGGPASRMPDERVEDYVAKAVSEGCLLSEGGRIIVGRRKVGLEFAVKGESSYLVERDVVFYDGSKNTLSAFNGGTEDLFAGLPIVQGKVGVHYASTTLKFEGVVEMVWAQHFKRMVRPDRLEFLGGNQ
jgi:hypothetical protein